MPHSQWIDIWPAKNAYYVQIWKRDANRWETTRKNGVCNTIEEARKVAKERHDAGWTIRIMWKLKEIVPWE